MRVYVVHDGEQRLVGRADIPTVTEDQYVVPLFGTADTIVERFAIGSITRHVADGQTMTERAILARPEQVVQILPGWQAMQA